MDPDATLERIEPRLAALERVAEAARRENNELWCLLDPVREFEPGDEQNIMETLESLGRQLRSALSALDSIGGDK